MRSSKSILLVLALSRIPTSIAYFNSTLDDCSRDDAAVYDDDHCCAGGGVCQNEPSTGIFVCCDTSIDEDCLEDGDPLGLATIPVPTFTTPAFVLPATQTDFAGSSGCDTQPDIQCTSADDVWYCPAYQPVCGTSSGVCFGSGPACLSSIPDSPFATESVDSGDSEPTPAAASSSADENNSTPSPEPTPPPEPSPSPEPTPLPESSPSPLPEPSSPSAPTTSVESIAPDIPTTEPVPTPNDSATPTATTSSVGLASSTAPEGTPTSELGTTEPSLSTTLPSSTPLTLPSNTLTRNSESSPPPSPSNPPTTLISNNTTFPTTSKQEVPSAPTLFTGGVPGRGSAVTSWWVWVGMGLLSRVVVG